MTAYYNEIDPFAAAWLRELIKAGHIAPGDVDERSIVDVRPDDLRGYNQAHWFAGIGVWSYALRRAGWPDDRPVWTGSCPCQPFSAAGKGLGFADERHLWPFWFHLIRECRPAVVFGEQVASKAVDPWIDLVQADLEAVVYAVGAVPFPSAGVGAPHIRDRTFWLADASRSSGQRERAQQWGDTPQSEQQAPCGNDVGGRNGLGGLADAHDAERRPDSAGGHVGDGTDAGRSQGAGHVEGRDGLGGVDNAAGARHARAIREPEGNSRDEARLRVPGAGCEASNPGPTNGVWRDADWLFCRDGKWRPVEPGTFPLAHGAPARVGRLRGYGNAINAEAAVAFVESYLEICPEC